MKEIMLKLQKLSERYQLLDLTNLKTDHHNYDCKVL